MKPLHILVFLSRDRPWVFPSVFVGTILSYETKTIDKIIVTAINLHFKHFIVNISNCSKFAWIETQIPTYYYDYLQPGRNESNKYSKSLFDLLWRVQRPYNE